MLQLKPVHAEGFASLLWSAWCLPVLAGNPEMTGYAVGYTVIFYIIIYAT